MEIFIKVLDFIIVLISFPLIIVIIGLRVLLFRLISGIALKYPKSQEEGLLQVSQNDFYSLEKKDVLFTFASDGGFFKHIYVIDFPSKKSEIIKYRQRHTFIEISRKFCFLKKFKMIYCYAVINLFLYYWRFIRLSNLVRKRITLIRGVDPHHTGLAAMLMSFITKVPYCVSIHNDYDSIFPDRGFCYVPGFVVPTRFLRKQVQRFILTKTKYILAITQYIADFALRNGAKKENIRLIPHGVDVEKFDKVDVSGVREEFFRKKRHLIVTVARLGQEKHVLDIPFIAKELIQLEPGCLFIIAGDGPERGALEKIILEEGLKDAFQLLGFQRQEKTVALRKIANVNLCLFDGYSLIEAALAARPIVAYDEEWHKELIYDNQTGLLVPNRDIKAAASAIKRLLDDPLLSDSLGRKARELAIKNHSFTSASKVKVEIYKEIIGSNYSPMVSNNGKDFS